MRVSARDRAVQSDAAYLNRLPAGGWYGAFSCLRGVRQAPPWVMP